LARRTLALTMAALLHPAAAISALPERAHRFAPSPAAQSTIKLGGVSLSRAAASFVAVSVHSQYRNAMTEALACSLVSWLQTAARSRSPAMAICAESSAKAAAASVRVRMVRGLRLADSRDYLPRHRPRRIPYPDVDDYGRRNRAIQDDIDAFDAQRRDWFRDTGDPRWRPPIDVPPPHCSRHGDCNEIGRRRW
jgi:hypothetical protein